MDWPSWRQAAVMALVCTVVGVGLRPVRPGRLRDALLATANELALLATLYGIWRLARLLPLATEGGAVERARRIDQLEHLLHLPSELTLQQLLLRHRWAGLFLNTYYAVVHVPSLLVFLAWLFARHRDAYARWRNALVFVTACCLFIRFIRVAPPRLLGDLGYIDIGEAFGWSIYGPVGTGVSDQYAAMPSIHVAWAAVVALGVHAVAPRPWNRIGPTHLVLTMLAVSATGYHWWLDGIVAIGLLLVGLRIDDARHRRWPRRVPGRQGAIETSSMKKLEA